MSQRSGWSGVGVDALAAVERPGAISMRFQPIVGIRSGRRIVHGIECLARGPAGTPLEDARSLFDLVRACRAEARIDRLCVAEAVRAIASLPDLPSYSINVHAKTLAEDLSFGPFLVDVLRRHGVQPHKLILDVLAPIDLTDALMEELADLRALGIAVAIDELGLANADYTGLAECRPDYIKIDRSFVRRCPPDDLRDLMLESMVRLARGMGASVVAEGVETLDELDAVLRQGIRMMQGNLFAKAMRAEDLRRCSGVAIGEPAACRPDGPTA